MSQELRPQEPLPAPMGHAAPPEIALPDEDREALRQAVVALEGPSYVARLSTLAGRPIELLGQALPVPVSDVISKATQAALTRALRYALKTIPKEGRASETRVHKVLAVLSGAMGEALGVSAVLVELPISTTIMLRSIARLAQSEGENLEDPETALACIQVFALGGHSGSDNLHEAGYFAAGRHGEVPHPRPAADGRARRRRRKRLGHRAPRGSDRFPVWGWPCRRRSPPRRFRLSGRSAARPSMPPSLITSRRWRAGISPCVG